MIFEKQNRGLCHFFVVHISIKIQIISFSTIQFFLFFLLELARENWCKNSNKLVGKVYYVFFFIVCIQIGAHNDNNRNTMQ